MLIFQSQVSTLDGVQPNLACEMCKIRDKFILDEQ